LIKFLDLQQDNITSYTIEDLFDQDSYLRIKEKIARCSNGLLNNFSEAVTLVAQNGEKFEVSLHVSIYERYSGHSLMIGLVTLGNTKMDENEVFISDVLKVLKKENIVVTNALGEKLTDIFKKRTVNMNKQESGFFSKRENQLLCLFDGRPSG